MQNDDSREKMAQEVRDVLQQESPAMLKFMDDMKAAFGEENIRVVDMKIDGKNVSKIIADKNKLLTPQISASALMTKSEVTPTAVKPIKPATVYVDFI